MHLRCPSCIKPCHFSSRIGHKTCASAKCSVLSVELLLHLQVVEATTANGKVVLSVRALPIPASIATALSENADLLRSAMDSSQQADSTLRRAAGTAAAGAASGPAAAAQPSGEAGGAANGAAAAGERGQNGAGAAAEAARPAEHGGSGLQALQTRCPPCGCAPALTPSRASCSQMGTAPLRDPFNISADAFCGCSSIGRFSPSHSS